MSRPSGKIGRDDQQLREHLLLGDLLQPRRDREQRLAGAGLADERDQLDVVVEQQIEREVLLLVARLDAPHALAQLLDRHGLADGLVPAGERALAAFVLERQELVGVEAGRVDDDRAVGVELVDRARRAPSSSRLPGYSSSIEIRSGLEVDRGEAERVAADAHVDVLGDHDRRRLGIGVADLERDLEDALIHRARVVARVLDRVLRAARPARCRRSPSSARARARRSLRYSSSRRATWRALRPSSD